MTRILALSNLYPPHAFGGYEWTCHDVMHRLRERGHDVEVLTTTTRIDGVEDWPDEEATGIHRVLEWYWHDHELVSPRVPARLGIERRDHRRLTAALERFRPEVVSVWNLGAMPLGLVRAVAAAGVPMVFAVCDEWPVYAPSVDAWGRLFASRPRLARLAEAVLGIPCVNTDLGPTGAWCFVSEYTRQVCRGRSPFHFPRSTVVHSGIEPADFPLFEDDGDDGGEFGWRLLYVGRLDERKGILTAVDALARLPEQSTLRVVGRGDLADAIRERARDRGVADRVTIEAADRAALAPVYRSSDVLLFTSEWDEPFGLTPIEAMACGTPVVGTGTGGSDAFLVDRQTCLRYPPGDAGALAAAVEELASDDELRRRLRVEGRALATELTTDRLADTFEAWHVAAACGFRDGEPPARSLRPDPVDPS